MCTTVCALFWVFQSKHKRKKETWAHDNSVKNAHITTRVNIYILHKDFYVSLTDVTIFTFKKSIVRSPSGDIGMATRY